MTNGCDGPAVSAFYAFGRLPEFCNSLYISDHPMNSLVQPIPRHHDHAAASLVGRVDAVQRAEPGVARTAAKDRLWPLLFAFLAEMTRAHAARFGGLDPGTLYDIVADKTLYLLDRVETRDWRPGSWSGTQARAYLSRAARHSVVDHFRSLRRSRHHLDVPSSHSVTADSGEDILRRWQFATALHDCVGQLRARVRVIWILRVFFEFSSKQIARHPSVGMKPAAIDVALARTRTTIRRCMLRKDLDSSALVPGTFTVLWERFKQDLLVNGDRDA